MPTPESLRDDLQPSEVARFQEVCRLGGDRIEPIAETIARAFASDPVWQWMHGRTEPVPVDEGLLVARAVVADTAPVDEIHGFRHHDAVALWRAPAGQVTEEMTAWKQARSAPYFEAAGPTLATRGEDLAAFGAATAAARPDEPHWYLFILATNPDRQSQGLGTAVVQAMLDRCDRLEIPTYLESTNPRNHGLYRRLGYEETGEITGGGSPPVMGFLRRPR